MLNKILLLKKTIYFLTCSDIGMATLLVEWYMDKIPSYRTRVSLPFLFVIFRNCQMCLR